MEKIGIGMAGFGYMGKIHLLSYKDILMVYPGRIPEIELSAVCHTSKDKADRTASENGFITGYADFEKMLEDDEINVVDIVTPNFLHKEQIIKALRAGKDVLCEKPLALNSAEAEEIVRVVEETGKHLGMIFNYRFIPALVKAKELIDDGRLGRVYSFRGEYFHTGYQNPDRPFSWRMDKAKSGGGALADMGIHVLDLLRYLLGEFETVQASTKTYIGRRPLSKGSSETAEVSVDDAAWLNATLRSGASGSVEISRFATGALDDLKISAFGEKGAFQFDLMDANYLYWFDNSEKEAGWKRIETLQHYPDTSFPAPRSIIGWTRFHLENQFRFLESVHKDIKFQPDAVDGLAAQKLLTAAYRSAETGLEEILL